jgi:hypothetical protein
MNRQFFIGVGLTALLAAGIIMWLLRVHGAEIAGKDSIIAEKDSHIIYHQNKAQEAIATVAQVRASAEAYKTAHPEEMATIVKEFAVRQEQLESYIRASFKAQNKGVSVVHTTFVPDTATADPTDSIQEASFDISDNYLTMHGDTRTQPGLPWLKVNWDYSYIDTLSFVGREQKNGFLGLGKKTYWLDGKVDNPKAQITSLRNFQVTDFQDKRWSVGPAVLFDPFSGTVRVGISAQYAILRF